MKKNQSTQPESFLITAALPYANGDIHIGHLLEYIQADIFTRFLKLRGQDALYICASDMHGTPVEVNARKAGKKPEEFAKAFWKEHQKDFASFLIKFDHYYKTHSLENKKLVESFFAALQEKGHITLKLMKVVYCSGCERSLPDRYVKGTCPNCGTADQYGDICESCNLALKGVDLVNPKCALCGKTPQQKESLHYFFTLGIFQKRLEKWLQDAEVQPEVKNWLQEWMGNGLEDWCISRDEPYFGFEIPGSKKETGAKKYFYVWLDAPIGYISATEHFCKQQGHLKKRKLAKGKAQRLTSWEEYWKKGKVHHFIGKDIVYFHFLFWPALLMAMEIPLPTLTVHGFITVNGQKMSKSRGTFFTAKDFLKLYPPEALRFFYASHLDNHITDVDVSIPELIALNNNVLVGSLGNFCYRVLMFAQKNYDQVSVIANEKELAAGMDALLEQAAKAYQKQDFRMAVKHILEMASAGNSYFQKAAPWEDPQRKKAEVGFSVNLARNLAIAVSPILPNFSAKVLKVFGGKSVGKAFWKDACFSWKGKLKPVERLVEKIEHMPQQFQFPLELVVGKIVEVKVHPHADQLYLLQVDLGREKRQVVAGLKRWWKAEDLLDKKVVLVKNLKPAKLRGEWSKAMILAADDGERVVPLFVEKSAVGEVVQVQGMGSKTEEVSFEEFQQLVMTVLGGRVLYDRKPLLSSTEEIIVKGVREGARVR